MRWKWPPSLPYPFQSLLFSPVRLDVAEAREAYVLLSPSTFHLPLPLWPRCYYLVLPPTNTSHKNNSKSNFRPFGQNLCQPFTFDGDVGIARWERWHGHPPLSCLSAICIPSLALPVLATTSSQTQIELSSNSQFRPLSVKWEVGRELAVAPICILPVAKIAFPLLLLLPLLVPS